MIFNIIASGSKGNATLIKYKSTLILIDLGIPLVCLNEGLKEINEELSNIDGAIFTHDHSDHISQTKALSPKIKYSLEGTIPGSLSNVVNLWQPFYIKDIKITPVLTIHDATNPCGYWIECGEETLLYMTDTGVVPEETLKFCHNPTYIIIESNHDISMEMKTNRPYELKSRILSEHGHLCNEDSAVAVCNLIGDKTKEIYLAHLSEEANTPDIALEAYKKIFNYFKIDFSKYVIKCAKQYESTIGGNFDEN